MSVRERSISFLERHATWVIILLMLLAVFLSFHFFQNQSLRLDESQSIFQTSRQPLAILNLIAQDVHVPLYHLILHVWELIFGTAVPTLRLLSLLFFVASIPMMYVVGKLGYNKRIGLYSTLIFTLSPFMNWYGNEIRMYSLFVFICLANQYFFIKLFKYKEDKTAWAGFALTAAFGIYTHYFFFLILATDALFYFLNRKLFSKDALKKFIIIASGLFLLILPWIVYVLILGKATNAEPNLILPTTVNLFNTFSQFLFGFQTDHLNTILVSLWPITILLGFFALRKNQRVTPSTFYFISCFLIPNAIAFFVSFVFEPIYLTRYLIFTMPSMYFLLSWLFSRYRPWLGDLCRIILIITMLLTMIYEAVNVATPVKEDYRDVSNYLTFNANTTDVIVVSAPFTIYPISYYYKGPVNVQTLPIWDQNESGSIPAFSQDEMLKDVTTLTANHENVWLLLSYDQGYQTEIENYFNNHFEQLQKISFSPGMTLYEYKLRYDYR